MNNQIYLIILFVGVITIIPTVDAQLSFGGEANQKSIEVTIDQSEIIHVKHVVYSSNSPGEIQLFYELEEKSLKITDEDGVEVEYGKVGNDIEGITGLLIFASQQNTIVEYDLIDIKTLENNLWSMNLEYPEKFSILLHEEINSIFLNNNLIELGDRKGLSINGGGNVNLQYYDNIPTIKKEIEWEENKFDVEIITDSKIEKFNFNQTEKSISFEVKEKNKFVTITMSEELLGGPYVLLLNNEKIQYGLIENKNTVSLTFKPQSTGQITIIGTTVIPEFSMFIPLIMGFMIILTVPFMKKFNLH